MNITPNELKTILAALRRVARDEGRLANAYNPAIDPDRQHMPRAHRRKQHSLLLLRDRLKARAV